MRRSSPFVSALILSFLAGCGGSAPEPAEPVAVVELPAPPKPATVAENTPPPEPEEPGESEEPEGDDDEDGVEGGVPEQEAKQVGILGALSSNGGSSVFGPLGQGSGLSAGVGGFGGLGAAGGGVGGLGGLGTAGSGGGGFGMGSSSGATTRLATSPNITGKLPPEVIRRIVRQHLGRIRLCYEKALVSKPALEGKVTVRFVISKSGAVASASDAGGSTIADKNVIDCALKVFKAMSFPAPADGAIVVVNYPIVFAAPGPPPPPAATPPAAAPPPAAP